jgi:hypothetical protein
MSCQLHASADLRRQTYPQVSMDEMVGVCPRAGMDDEEEGNFLNLPGLELGPFGHQISGQSIPTTYLT